MYNIIIIFRTATLYNEQDMLIRVNETKAGGCKLMDIREVIMRSGLFEENQKYKQQKENFR